VVGIKCPRFHGSLYYVLYSEELPSATPGCSAPWPSPPYAVI